MQAVRKLARFARLAEWWEYKLCPLLAVAYATLLFSERPAYTFIDCILLILLAIAIGAIYVSLINDITDIDEDRRAGKRTGIMNVPSQWRWVFPIICLSGGAAICWCLWPDLHSTIWYVMAWISFSLYSIKPFRFKQRSILGVFADASGAHLFPSLFVVSVIFYQIPEQANVGWELSVGIWSFSYGMRGILWHQFIDRENDRITGVRTFASSVTQSQARRLEWPLLGVELVAFGSMLWYINLPIVYVFLLGYGLVVWLRIRFFDLTPIVFLIPGNRPYQVIMLDGYQVFLPLALLVHIALSQPWGWIILIVHFTLFPVGLKRLISDLMRILSSLRGL